MKLIPNVVRGTVARQSLKLDKASPNLLFGLGIAGMVGSTVLACRATLKMHEVLEQASGDLETASGLAHRALDDYPENEHKRDVTIIYARGVVQTAKLYAPSVLLGAAAVGCLTKSHGMLQQRNLALTAAYAAVDEAFRSYRERVVSKYGEEQDREFRYDARDVEILAENGRTKAVRRVGPGGQSMYARFFDQTSASWSKDPEYNNVFLICQQNWANDVLKARGHIFLNEVYRSLGMTDTRAGAVVGWVISRDDVSDNYIDFGIFEGETQTARDFVNGREGAILLDFNVDGVIYDKIDDPGEALTWQG